MGRASRSDRKSMVTAAGVVEYRDIGAGDPVVFVHGALLNGALWDDVAFYLPPDLRLIRLDLPLGGHRLPAAVNADLSPPALARLLLHFLHILDLDEVTLAASDGGVAICRLAACSGDARANRIRRLLLTNCDAFHEQPALALDSVAAILATSEGRRDFFARLVWTVPPDEQIRDMLGGFIDNSEIRRDAWRAQNGTARLPLAAAGEFRGVVKIIWGLHDRCVPLATGKRLAATFPDAELCEVGQARLLVPIDQPEVVAEALIEMIARGGPPHH